MDHCQHCGCQFPDGICEVCDASVCIERCMEEHQEEAHAKE